ncbi:MAG: hypothetical protein PVI07_07715 [Anaerolineae bacterium]
MTDTAMLSRAGLLALLIVILLAGCAIPHTPEVTAPPVVAAKATPSSSLTAAPAPPLTWETLRNTADPNEWPSEGTAQLEDGEYREQYMPGSATEMVINLAPYRLFGELNGDGVEDAAVILIAAPGGLARSTTCQQCSIRTVNQNHWPPNFPATGSSSVT